MAQPPSFVHSVQQILKSAHAAHLQLGHSPAMGYGLYSARDISSGEIVLVERPTVVLVCETALASTCGACLDEGHELMRACDKCNVYNVCPSDKCRTAFQQRHGNVECALLQSDAYASITDATVREYVRYALEMLRKPSTIPTLEAALCSPLVAGRDKALEAAMAVLKRNLPQELNFTAKMPALRQVLGKCSCNAHGLYRAEWNDVRGGGGRRSKNWTQHENDQPSSSSPPQVAVCVCTELGHLFNHSCFPNVVVDHFTSLLRSAGTADPQLVFRALRDISANQQLFISYAVCRDSTNARQGYLEKTMHFRCGCERCGLDGLEDDPLEEVFCEESDCSLIVRVAEDGGAERCGLCGKSRED